MTKTQKNEAKAKTAAKHKAQAKKAQGAAKTVRMSVRIPASLMAVLGPISEKTGAPIGSVLTIAARCASVVKLGEAVEAYMAARDGEVL